MSNIAINNITNGIAYLNGVSMLGRVAEMKLPDIEAIMAQHDALGMRGDIELPSGFKKLDGEIKWASHYLDVAGKLVNPFVAHAIQVRSTVDAYGPIGRVGQVELVNFLTLTFTNFPMGNFKPRVKAEFTTKFQATHVKQIFNGVEVFEFDYLANIFRVNGVDI